MSISLLRITALIAAILWMPVAGLFAQDSLDARFGSIPDSLYSMQSPADNPDAPYIITNKELDVSFRETEQSIVAVLEHHVRKKVFEDSVREASVVAIPYYFDNNMEHVVNIQAYTHLPSGERIPVEDGDIRTININSRYNVKEFTMPQVQEGAILEYRYVIQRRYIEELPDFFLGHQVPTAATKLTITYPEYLRYQPFVEDYNGKIDHDFVYTDTSSVPKVFTIPQPKPIVTERWMAYNIPAVEDEAFMSSMDDYRAKIKFLLSEFGIPRQQLENSWEVVVARIREKTNPWWAIRSNNVAEARGDSIASAMEAQPPEAIQDSIFKFVNQKVNYSGEHRPYSLSRDRGVIAGQPSDQAAINQTLISMLHGAGIDANPVLVSTRPSGQINMDFPSFYQFDSQLVQSKINGETHLMDASFAHSQPGLIRVDAFNGRGLVMGQDSFEWIDLKPEKSNFDIQVAIDAQLQSNGTLVGKVNAQQGGYPAQFIRQQRADGNSDADILKRVLFDGYPQMSVDSVQISNIDSYNEPIAIAAQFEIENYATSFTDGLKFRPMIVGYQRENPFKDKSRQHPITLDAPEHLDLLYEIDLPSGFRAPENRQNKILRFPGAEFRETYDTSSGALKYEYQIDISQKNFSTDFFSQLYKLYERWVQLSNTAWLIEN